MILVAWILILITLLVLIYKYYINIQNKYDNKLIIKMNQQ